MFLGKCSVASSKEKRYRTDDESTISAASSRSRTASESSMTSVSSKSSAASNASTVSKASSKSNASSATEAGDTASLVEHSETTSTKASTASLLDTSAADDLPVLNSARSEKSNSDATSVNSVRELAAAGDFGEQSLPMKERSVSPVKESEPVKEVTITKPMRPKSAHPSRARRTSTTSSTKSVNIPNSMNRSLDIEQHLQRMLLSTGKSSKDVSHLLEAVLVMDQKESQMENKPTNVMQPRMPSAKSRNSNFKQNERQREIQKENARLLSELTKNRRPQSSTSLSGRSTRSARSINSAFSTASSTSRYSTNFTPIARNYHSKINRDREAKRIDQENLAFLRRLNSVKASPHIRTSRNAVTAAPALRSRPKSIRPTVTHTWQDGW